MANEHINMIERMQSRVKLWNCKSMSIRLIKEHAYNKIAVYEMHQTIGRYCPIGRSVLPDSLAHFVDTKTNCSFGWLRYCVGYSRESLTKLSVNGANIFKFKFASFHTLVPEVDNTSTWFNFWSTLVWKFASYQRYIIGGLEEIWLKLIRYHLVNMTWQQYKI